MKTHSAAPSDYMQAYHLVPSGTPSGTEDLITKVDVTNFEYGLLVVTRSTGDSDTTWSVLHAPLAAGPFVALQDRDGNAYSLNFDSGDTSTMKVLEFRLHGSDEFIDIQRVLNSGTTASYGAMLYLFGPRRTELLPALSTELVAIGFS